MFKASFTSEMICFLSHSECCEIIIFDQNFKRNENLFENWVVLEIRGGKIRVFDRGEGKNFWFKLL